MQPLQILKKYYGYSSFRPGQEEIINNIIAGKDTLVLMPTGGGKSLCYQIPALALPGTAIVVSPLIALMNDQVQSLQANGVPAMALHSNQSEFDNQVALRAAADGSVKIIYISPERLMLDIDRIAASVKVSLIAIDEAHCISQWGHDFRPVYKELAAVKTKFQDVPVMALTATADRLTRLDISESLGLKDPFCWIGSFDRPNISLQVVNDPGKKGRLRVIAQLIDSNPLDSGIVYCLSRKKTEDMHKALSEMGYRSVCYHAGMHPSEREHAQRMFVNGEAQVVCATIAFGMGIDKSNIRWVVHNNIPGNIESYYQEIGRAGRDGMPAKAIMFYNFGDIITRRSFVDESGQREVNNEKLDFMQRYAEATICRRRILLSYFSEESNCDCGNCDNCRSPRAKFDGTILAQKALSAVIRINCAEGINTVIDILRGLNNSTIIQKRYHQIKTYGAGRDLGSRQWHSYILQMIQLGLFEVAYEDNFHLRPTPYGMKVVKGLERIELATHTEFQYTTSSRKKNIVEEPRYLTKEEELTEILKKLRLDIAQKEEIPAFRIFSDATLADMVEKLPGDVESFSKVTGVGELKLIKYGQKFVSAIRKFQGIKPSTPIGYSKYETLYLFNAGKSPEEIAAIKSLQVGTILNHLAELIDEGKIQNPSGIIPQATIDKVEEIMDKEGENAYKILKEKHLIPPSEITFAQAVIRQKRKQE
ncbi:MAG: DNA helicase RecQ [Muribaculaceae bacterium]|nr:DNA helicase RecQ [Muribaculaceae bacterium]MDE6753095.1 DNA helicase RecQ [Muribaculaceae bacterium]